MADTENTENIVNNGLASALGLDNVQTVNNPLTILNNATNYLLSMNWVQLTNTYKSNGFAKMAVDLPVSDTFRDGGFELESATASPDDLLELRNKMDKSQDVEIIKQCLRWGRLYGGGCLVVNTNQKPETPFNPETIYNKDVEFIACDRWQCIPNASALQLADSFSIADYGMGEDSLLTYDKSRVKVFTGEVQPYYLRNMLNGWGASIFESIIPQLTQYIKANSVVLELLDEAKIDILKIFGLSDLLISANGEQAVKKRVEIFAKNKNYKTMGVMDTQDDYEQKTMSFSGLNELLEKIFLLICSSLRIPYSKVFGKGSSGFSNGEDDLENYNAMIMSDLRVPCTSIIEWVAQIRACQLFGSKIDDLRVVWKPLRVLKETEQQQVKSAKTNSIIQLIQTGVLTKQQGAQELVKDGIINLSDEEIENIDNEFNPDEMDYLKETKSKADEENKKGGILNWFK